MAGRNLNWTWFVYLFVGLLFACTTPQKSQQFMSGFSEFPLEFKATQVLTVRTGEIERSVIAAIVRKKDNYRVTFLDSAIFVPLATLIWESGRFSIEDHRNILKDMPIEPAMIMESIREVYALRAKDMTLSGEEALFTGKRFQYAMSQLKERGGCGFPVVIRMVALPPVNVVMVVKTSEWEC